MEALKAAQKLVSKRSGVDEWEQRPMKKDVTEAMAGKTEL